MNKKNTIVIFSSFFIIMIVIFILYSFKKNESLESDKVVEVTRVARGTITQTVRLIGTIQAKRSTVLVAKQEGILSHVIEAGTTIQANDLIANLENVDFKNTHALNQNAEKIAKKAYERVLELDKKKVASKRDVEIALVVWINARKDLARAKIELDKTRVTAPFDGIVGSYKARDGSQVKTGEPLVVFYQPNNLVIEFDVPEPLVPQASQEKKVFIHGKLHKLTHIQKLVDPDTHMSPAFLEYTCKDCLAGSNIDLDLVVREHEGALIIPYECMFLRNDKLCVFVVQNNKAILKEVKLGIRAQENIEVIQGLEEGEQVILRGQARLYPDMNVKIHTS